MSVDDMVARIHCRLLAPDRFLDDNYGLPPMRVPWLRPKVARGITGGARYWRRRRWWPRYERIMRRAAGCVTLDLPPDLHNAKVRVGVNSSGHFAIDVEGAAETQAIAYTITFV